ncbi:ATP-binding protein [Pedobacter sp. KACC 23697]|uniref:ATP-binding protein n=1 Tax=Pedobacter sp. KACC 23697 TaxID=3149230 RepID=UPI0038781A68
MNADEDHLDFVISNLLSNAIKFSIPSSSIAVDFKRTENGHIVIVVKDAGKWMAILN